MSPLEREHRGLLDSGIKLMRKGEYDKALGLYHTIISQEARSTKFLSDAYHLSGIAHHYQGPLALDRLRSAPAEPTPEQWKGFVAHSKEAEGNIRKAIALNPENGNFYNTLGETLRMGRELLKLDRGEDAAQAYATGIDVHAPGWREQPAHRDATLPGGTRRALAYSVRDITKNYATALINIDRDDEAEFMLEKVIGLCEAIGHDCRTARYNLGIAQRKSTKYKNGLDRALQTYETLREDFPDNYVYWLHVLITKQMMSRLHEAIEGYTAILADAEAGKAVPGDTVQIALGNLGAAYQESGDFDSAIRNYKKVLETHPHDGRAHNNLGASLWQIGDAGGAVDAYKKAIHFEPNAAEAYINLGVAYYEYGRLDEAKRVYERAYELGGNDGIRVRVATMTLPIMTSREAIAHDRKFFRQNIMSLMRENPPPVLRDPVKDVERVHFYFVYHGENELENQRMMANFYLSTGNDGMLRYVTPKLRQFPFGGVQVLAEDGLAPAADVAAADHTSLYAPSDSIRRAAREGKIVVGFISKFLVVNHAHGQLLEGIIRELDRTQFHVVVLMIPNPQNTILPSIKEHADEIVDLPFALVAVRSMIGALGLDILVYADMLSEPLSYFMGTGTRLAPVQAVFWGNPLTSGSPDNIDYFITGEWMEPEGRSGQHDDGDGQYSEQAVRLRGQGIYYDRIPVPKEGTPFETVTDVVWEWEATDRGAVTYICAQSVFKLHPDYDLILNEILSRNPSARLVLLQGRRGTWTEMVSRRMEAAMSKDAFRRVHFTPRVGSSNDYMRLLQKADVVLHPFPFGGSKTSADAIALGLPLVTKPTGALRGRMAYSYFVTMGVFDTVAESDEQYVDIAVRLGNDPAWRREVSRKVKEKSHLIFQRSTVVTAWSLFFLRAHRLAQGDDDAPPVRSFGGDLPKPNQGVTRPPANAHEEVPPQSDAAGSRSNGDVGPKIDTWLGEAYAAYRRGDVITAENRFRRVLRYQPDNAGVHNDFGSVLKHARRLKEAEHEYQIAIGLQPNYVVAMGNLGVVRHEMHDWQGAARMYKRVLELKPLDSSALYNLGNVYRDIGDIAGGAGFYRSALHLKYLGGDLVMLLSLLDQEGAGQNAGALVNLERHLKQAHLLDQGVALGSELERLEEYTDAINNLAKLALEAGTLGAAYDADGVPWVYNQWTSMLAQDGARSASKASSRAEVHVLVQYYESSDAEHQGELRSVLTSHAQNPDIDKVHVFVEENYELNSMFNFRGVFLNMSKVTRVVVGKRLTFQTAFAYANQYLPSGSVAVLANSDIGFDDTIAHASKIAENVVYAMLRWEFSNPDGTARLEPRVDSQDVWIFQTPLRMDLDGLDFYLGQPRCDNRLAAAFVEQGLKVENPAFRIRTYHHQKNTNRAYTNDDHVPGAIKMVKLTI